LILALWVREAVRENDRLEARGLIFERRFIAAPPHILTLTSVKMQRM